MPRYKLTYFDFSGSRGEECRLTLHLAGLDFEDHRIQREQWAALKPTTPYGVLPILEVEGRPPLAHSNAILGYLGRQHGLLPDDAWEAARHEAVMAAAEDLRVEVGASSRLQDPEEKRLAREAFAAGPMQAWAARIERQIEGPFLGGASIGVADIKLFLVMRAYKQGVLDHIPRDVFAAHRRLEELYSAVESHPRIVDWCSRH
jgi:glutathione S-transferase